MKTTKVLHRLLLPSLLAAFGMNSAQAAVTLVEKDGWTVKTSGFAELDMIKDSTQSVGEAPGEVAIKGGPGRTQFSVRNSRLAFDVAAPVYEDWKTHGYVELDFLGVQPASKTSGATEGTLYNSGTLRMRHYYFAAEKNGLEVLAGQYWSLMGWQPVYVMPSLQVAPLPGEMYQRLAQVRITDTVKMGDAMDMQIAGGLFRPTQRDSGMPDVNLGVRLAFNGLKGGYSTAGSAAPVKLMPASVAVTGTYRSVSTLDPNGIGNTNALVNSSGMGIAADLMIPIIPAKGDSVGNTLTFGGEFSIGKGYGNEFPSWTGGYANPLNSAANSPDKNGDVDAGIGGYASDNTFFLYDIRSFNAYLQYHFNTELPTFVSLGYGQFYSDNAANAVFGTAPTSITGQPYDTVSTAFINFMHNFTPAIRAGIEYAHTETHFAEYKSNGQTGTYGNERFQVGGWFAF